LNGKLYSTTNYGGTSNQGVIYEYTPASNAFVKRHDFQGGVLTNSYTPTSLVVKNGKLYGTSHGGGVPETNLPGGGGTLFEFDLTTNQFTTKYNFLMNANWLGDVGTFPSSLVAGANGKLYGVTEFGMFEYNPSADIFRMAGRFWARGFAPSILQLCRKPAYQAQQATREICAGAQLNLDLGTSNTTSIIWKHDGITDASQTTPTLNFESFSPTDAGVWICTMTNACGSTTSQALTLSINEPAQPVITIEGPTIFCAGETTELSAPEGFAEYHWSNGETSREIVVGENGEYAVSVNNGCESPLSEPVVITVNDLPPAPTSIESISFNKLKAIGSGASYEWRLNGNKLEETADVITVTESGVYEVRAVNDEGCMSAESALLSFVVTALESDSENNISLYPNPADEMIHIDVPGNFIGLVDLILYSSKGQLIRSQPVSFDRNGKAIYVGDLSPGIYYVLFKKGTNIVSIRVSIY
jgi:uncharacterized repeat protein (TIGR03803 family)